MSSIKKETRYVVIKIKDAENCLTTCEKQILETICDKVSYYRDCEGKRPLDCIVVEEDWPEHDIVWQMIVERMSDAM